jgi:hypothetical protein
MSAFSIVRPSVRGVRQWRRACHIHDSGEQIFGWEIVDGTRPRWYTRVRV